MASDSDITTIMTPETPETPETTPTTAASTYETCEQCAAPVEQTQRYCVVCGTRRRHVDDPAARFMATATSKTRQAARNATQQTASARSQRGVSLGLALAVALIPAGLGVGVLIGNGHDDSASQYQALIAAVKAQKQEVINVGGGAASANTGTSTGTSTGASSTATSKHSAKSAQKGSKTSSSTATTAAPPASTTKPPTKAALSSGAQVVAKESHQSGKSYIGSQQGLPNVVAVP